MKRAKKSNLEYVSNRKTQKINTRQVAQQVLKVFTILIGLCSVLLLLSGGWGVIALVIALPFIAFGLFVLWGIYIAAPSFMHAFSKKTSNKAAPSNVLIARLSMVLIIWGSILLGWFIYQGGPHNAAGGPSDGAGHHILGNSSPYLDMQAGILLLILGVTLALINHGIAKFRDG